MGSHRPISTGCTFIMITGDVYTVTTGIEEAVERLDRAKTESRNELFQRFGPLRVAVNPDHVVIVTERYEGSNDNA